MPPSFMAVMSHGTLSLRASRSFALNIPSNKPTGAWNTDVKCFSLSLFYTLEALLLKISEEDKFGVTAKS